MGPSVIHWWSEPFSSLQVISNACATQALLHVLLNAEDAELGDVLENFKSFTLSLPPDLRGDAMNSCEEIRRAHNSFARAEPFMPEEHARDSESVRCLAAGCFPCRGPPVTDRLLM